MGRPKKGRGFPLTLWDKVEKNAPGGCWLWRGSIKAGGYGGIGVPPDWKVKRVHRVAYELCVGTIPDGLDVLHSCDVRNCVNPEHLWVGTDSDNQRDCSSKGRKNVPKGIENYNCKLSKDQIDVILEKYQMYKPTQKALAREFGVSQCHICRIVNNHARMEA